MSACAFTGHRNSRLPFGSNENDERCLEMKSRLRTEIIKMITENNVRVFYTGMALGVDMIAAELVADLKRTYPYIKLVAAIPCACQTRKWNSIQTARYYKTLRLCDEITVLQNDYTDTCMTDRNYYMVNQSSFLIAVWNGTPSGTANTIRHAKDLGISVTVIRV